MVDYTEVLAYLAGLNPEENDDLGEIEAHLQDKYGISDISVMEEIVDKLFNVINVARSPLTDTVYIGFSVEDEQGRGFWLAKKEVK